LPHLQISRLQIEACHGVHIFENLVSASSSI
jgi:hypothetical protein